jgi:hypothetical protein
VRNFVIAFFVLLLPLQWGTAVIAAYCMHEEGSFAIQHFGHHTHDHEHLGSEQSVDDQGKVCDSGVAADHDHSHGTHAIFAVARSTDAFANGPEGSPYGVFVPDPPFDNLYRPPQAVLV